MLVPMPTAPLILLLAAAPVASGSYRAELEAGQYLKVLAETEARLRQQPGDAAAWAARAQALASFQRFAEARAAADRALALNPGLADALLARGLARAGEAIRQRDLGSLRGALGALDDCGPPPPPTPPWARPG